MKEIGGFFELELSHGHHYHNGALRFNSARSCLEQVLRVRKYQKVFVPYYTCEIVLQPFQLLHIEYDFYRINEQLEPIELPDLKDNEAFLYTNYFGLKQSCVERLAQRYGKRLIVDNAQAFFAKPITGIDTFYSPRKFLGVPDGGYLYCDGPIDMEIPQSVSYDRMSHLLKRMDIGAEGGYGDFKHNDEALAKQSIMRMSHLTEKILESVNYQRIINTRRNNYQLLADAIGTCNQLIFSLSEYAVPMVYPFMSNNKDLKKKLIENKIFVATYWPNVMDWCKEKTWEYQLAQRTCFLPVDQRYGQEDMNKILNVLQK